MSDNATRPTRRSDVLVRRVGGEVVLYDGEADTAHLLNETAAFVWERLDGQTPVDSVIDSARTTFGHDSARAMVEVALADLSDAGLLVSGQSVSPSISRRSLLKALGAAAVVAPAVLTLRAPAAAAAGASTLCINQGCQNNGDCSGNANCATVNRTHCCKSGTGNPLNNICVSAFTGSGSSEVCTL